MASAPRLQYVQERPPIQDWYHHTEDSFQNRLAGHHNLTGSENVSSSNQSRVGKTSTISMAMTDHSHTQSSSSPSSRTLTESAPASLPSLTVDSSGFDLPSWDSTQENNGVETIIPGIDEQGVLIRPPSYAYQCAFPFLGCTFRSVDLDEWMTHCFAHFHPIGPPRAWQCPLCPQAGMMPNGHDAWRLRLHHVAGHHQAGESLSTARPDFALFKYLRDKRIIDDTKYRDLMVQTGTSRMAQVSVSFEGRRRRDFV